MSKYTIKINGDEYNKEVKVEEKTRKNTGVEWITITNTIDTCKTLEEAKKKYPKHLKKGYRCIT